MDSKFELQRFGPARGGTAAAPGAKSVAISTFARRLMLWRILSTTGEGLRLRELARRLEVSKNTVQRDLDALTTAGIPVEEERRGQASFFRIGGGGGSGVGDGVLGAFSGTPSPPRVHPAPRRSSRKGRGAAGAKASEGGEG